MWPPPPLQSQSNPLHLYITDRTGILTDRTAILTDRTTILLTDCILIQ